MLQGIKFNDLHSYLDFGLVLTKKTIGTPTPKTQIVEVAGADGQIDFTDYIGEIKYSNRDLSFEFEIIQDQADYVLLFSEIQNALHGKRMKIILDIDEEFYYLGRVTVNEWQSDKKIGKIVIDVDAEPYKYRLNPTVSSVMIGESGTVSINLLNLKRPVTPTFILSHTTTIEFGDLIYNQTEGTYIFYDIRLTEGNNPITFKSIAGATITVSYQEGEL